MEEVRRDLGCLSIEGTFSRRRAMPPLFSTASATPVVPSSFASCGEKNVFVR